MFFSLQVVSAAGAVEHDKIVSMVSRMFTHFSTDPSTAKQVVDANPAVFSGSEVCFSLSLNRHALVKFHHLKFGLDMFDRFEWKIKGCLWHILQ